MNHYLIARVVIFNITTIIECKICISLCISCSRYNNLLLCIHQSLRDLLKALKGLVVMSQTLEDLANSLFVNQIPKLWSGKVRSNFIKFYLIIIITIIILILIFENYI